MEEREKSWGEYGKGGDRLWGGSHVFWSKRGVNGGKII